MAAEVKNPIVDLFYLFVAHKNDRLSPGQRLECLIKEGWAIELPDTTDTRTKLKHDYDCYVYDVFDNKLTPSEICKMTREFMKREHNLMVREIINDDAKIDELQQQINKLRAAYFDDGR